MSIEEMLREMAGESKSRREPSISHVGQIARLQEFKVRFEAGCPFKAGDLVTPRKDGLVTNPGSPQLVLSVRENAGFDFSNGDPGSINYGRRTNMLVAKYHSDSIARYWTDSLDYEPYTEAHEKSDPERDLEAA